MSTDRKHGDGPSYPIPVWNGIFDHRPKIGAAIWVYLWCLDRITAEKDGIGIVLGGTAVCVEKIAAEVHEDGRSVRRHVRLLGNHGYLRLTRAPHGFVIAVTNSRKFNIWRSDKSSSKRGVFRKSGSKSGKF